MQYKNKVEVLQKSILRYKTPRKESLMAENFPVFSFLQQYHLIRFTQLIP